jgi:sterol desaturase/sphingolipid hydroxylase (fatty acid hydroxylase superfamily)
MNVAGEAAHVLASWCVAYAGLRGLLAVLAARVPTSADAHACHAEMERAIGWNACVFAIGDAVRGWWHGSSSVCGMWSCADGRTVERCAGMFVLAEAVVYRVHVAMHRRSAARHRIHHAHRRTHVSVAYAFAPEDGVLQGLGLPLAYACIAVPYGWYVCLELTTALWTLFIHLSPPPHAPWPLLGPAYHEVHHALNWYNFGFLTRFQDWLHGTLREPSIRVSCM